MVRNRFEIKEGVRYRSRGIPMRLDHTESWIFWIDPEYTIDGHGWLAITIREIVDTKLSGDLVVYYKQWFSPDGEALSLHPKRTITSRTGLERLMKNRGMMPWYDFSENS